MVFGSVGAPAAPEALVYLVDEDDGELKALARLLRAHGLAVRALPSATAFLRAHDPAVAGCAVLDVHLPGMDGLALQQALRLDGAGRPVVFITGSGEVEQGVRAMKAGAVDFLTKPVDEAALLGAVLRALALDAAARPARAELQRIRGCLESLTPREREVLRHVVAGRLNKQIAADLGIAERTIKVHRARAMEKMGAASLAQLVRKTLEVRVGAVFEDDPEG